jgi:glutamate racemase
MKMALSQSGDCANPIGVFDSGIGGLTVLQQIRATLHGENLLYVSDSWHFPYGGRSPDFISNRAVAITEFLIDRGAKAIVVACNTATAASVDVLRARYQLPIIGIEPAIKPAVAMTRSGGIGVLATEATLRNPRFHGLIKRFGAGKTIIAQPCPGLADCIEKGDWERPELRFLVTQFVKPLIEKGVDTIVLGCTHYAFIHALIQEVCGPAVAILEVGKAVALHLKNRLQEEGILEMKSTRGSEQFWTSGDPIEMRAAVNRLW